MNQFAPSPSSHEATPSQNGVQAPMNEIPSFPLTPEQIQQQTPQQPPTTVEQFVQQAQPQMQQAPVTEQYAPPVQQEVYQQTVEVQPQQQFEPAPAVPQMAPAVEAPPAVEMAPNPAGQVEQQTYNVPEAQQVPVSEVPQLQTKLEYKTTKEGERVFNNPNLGQTTFKGGVTSQQLVSKVSGYYTVSQGLINNPHTGLLQQTAQTGSASQATTWQAVMLMKILQALWKSLGLV